MKIEQFSSAVVQSVKANEVTLYTGDKALALLKEEAFQESWDILYDSCPWATVFQSRPFVTTWYQIYRPEFSPIIVTSTYGDKLTGLVTLTATHSSIKKKRGHIVGAGKYDAAYQVWLAEDKDNNHFIKAAISKVLQAFPGLVIHFRYVKNHVPLQWIDEASWKNRCLLETYSCPLMEMKDPSLSKLPQKTTYRNCSNRLKRLGEVKFEHILSEEQLAANVNDFMIMYDFRQGAMFNRNQFLDDPLKEKLFWALFEQGLLYVVELKVKDHLFASVSGVTDKGWLYFSGGFITHSPFRAKYYSPGYLQIVMLSQLLTKEGMTGVDLSPGGDSYKDRLASRYEDVHELLITNNPLYYLKRKLRYKYFKKLEKAGKRPMSVELAWKKRKYLLKARLQKAKQEGLFRFAAKKLNQYIHPPKELIYVATTATLKNTAAMSVNKNNLRDMLCFVSKGTAMSRWEFLEDAMSRYENGECSYTYCYEGQLLGCVWVAEKQKANADKNIASDPTIELHQFYCHPTGESRHKEFLGTVATLITQERKSETIYAIASNEDKTLCKALEQVGFKVDA